MTTISLTDEQKSTYNELLDFGFGSDQARHAAVRYSGNTSEAANWLIDNPSFDFSSPPSSTALSLINDYRPSTPTSHDEPPPLIDMDRTGEEEDLPHPRTIGRTTTTTTTTTTTDNEPPPPDYESVYGPKTYQELPPPQLKKPQALLPTVHVARSEPSKPDINLTGQDEFPSSLEATDLQRAIKASTHLNTQYSFNNQKSSHNDHLNPTSSTTTLGGEGEGGGGGGEDEMSKALALSMASLGSNDDLEFVETGFSQMEGIKPQERIRESLSTPVVLRSTSPHMSTLSSYLQCLYSIPTWRNTILGWRAPPTSRDDELLVDVEMGTDDEESFEGVWKGDLGMNGAGFGGGGGGGGNEEEMRIFRLRSLQRLFALMKESRRSFVHVQEVVKAFGLRESQFHTFSGINTIRGLHSQIINDLTSTLSSPPSSSSTSSIEDLKRSFTVQGRRVISDEWIGNPLSPLASSSTTDPLSISTEILTLEINPAAQNPKHESFYERLDQLLLENVGGYSTRPGGGGGEGQQERKKEFHLLIEPVPKTLLFHLNRQTELTSLDDFGTTTSTTTTTTTTPTTTTMRSLLRVEKELWLDRYYVKRRKEIKEGREKLDEMRNEFEDVRDKRDRLGKTRDGKSSVDVVRGVVEYLEGALGGDVTSEEGEEEEKRKERQEKMRGSYRAILETMETKIKEYETQLEILETSMTSLFSSPNWRTLGPYRLTSILFRNGLNGRGSSWSVTLGDDGEWYRISDLDKERIDLDKVLSDKTGLFLDAGITFAFYQLQEVEVEEKEVPDHLKRTVARDNHSFASTLPESHSETINSWNLPPLECLPLTGHSTHQISFGDSIARIGQDEDDDADTVQNISLSPPPEEEQTRLGGVDTPMSVDSDKFVGVGIEGTGEDDEELEPLIPEKGGHEVEMSRSDTGSSDEEVAMRLRGGATVEDNDEVEEDEDEDDYDEDEIDEDEVELGLLQPMPEKKEDWDIDYAVGKVGGLPVWLDPRSPLEVEQVACGVCSKTMSMLLQVNSPDDTRPHAAARSLYVFACRSRGCLTADAKKALKVWRTQMSSPNEFFPHTEESTTKRRELESALDSSSALSGTPSAPTKPWPEWDIAAEPEPYEESYLPDPEAPSPEQAEGEDAEAADTVSGVDKEFLAFQERIEREPRQVLRFYRLPDIEAPEPLWTSRKKIDPSEVPPCELCRGPREVEFQILSTLLSRLEDDNLDFDSLLVYTCLDNCEIPPRAPLGDKTGWASEVIYKQDFTSSGVKFGQRN